MDVDLFSYDLPPGHIAQHPLPSRDQSRMLVLGRQQEDVHDSRFCQLASWLEAGDLLVYNDTRVLPARLLGRKMTGGQVEVFLLDYQHGSPTEEVWQCLYKSSKSVRLGQEICFGEEMRGRVVAPSTANPGAITLLTDQDRTVRKVINAIGKVPLPPYIKRDPGDDDRHRYQTIFAEVGKQGAVAAPTAGLHFTPELLASLKAAGVLFAPLTLHVGLGTFSPVKAAVVEDHQIHRELFEISTTTLERIAETKSKGKRVIAIGTTVTRALEYQARTGHQQGWCDLFIYPGYIFQVIDGLITNFHLPRSTLLMLVAAYAGRQRMLAAYRHAVREGYRFYSYGDGMLIL
ncbi:MAG: tRNA preQ1(34) S-adenosylmethionine ribosyltransferase-isomerase QueA [Deltaproteobacteria bacterium]|nr:tRNA preQ1(34) S-adenosylmethionine ribosyltransferase-isomerase QueA [Candidatus Anaeroferrophillus wilburensis]MBN2889858.1 tRNA preQ1(34) S-adenosylmethionine ribosyltransferase-isomerase QueA [Deltaproteobacteria bacterium]